MVSPPVRLLAGRVFTAVMLLNAEGFMNNIVRHGDSAQDDA
jgi:hypothetical protein